MSYTSLQDSLPSDHASKYVLIVADCRDFVNFDPGQHGEAGDNARPSGELAARFYVLQDSLTSCGCALA